MLNAKLMHAAASGNVKDVKKLLLKGALFTKDQDGNTALHEAARNGYAEVVQLLLKASCFPDGYNNKGVNSLHIAAQQGHANVVKILLKHKANTLLANKHGETALHIASKFSHPDVISAFAECNANMNVMMENGDTALHVAAKYGNLSALRVLLLAESDPFIRNKDGWLACEAAEMCGQKEAKVLLECLMQEKCKDYHPRSKQLQRESSVDSGMQMGDDIAKRRRSKLFTSFKSSITRLRRSSSTSADVSNEAALSPKESGYGSSNTARFSFNGEATKTMGNSGATENGKVAMMSLQSSPTRSERRRSIQFSEPEVVNRTYESVDEVVSKIRSYQQPVLAQVTPAPGTGPVLLASSPGMGMGIRPQQLGMGRQMDALPVPPQRRESTDEYVAMAPSILRGGGMYGSQWDTVSISSKQGGPKSILHSTLNTLPSSSAAPVDLQDELDTMRKAFEIRLIQLEKRYQRHLAKVETPPLMPATRPRLPTWGPSSTQGIAYSSSLNHSRQFSSALRCGPVGADMGSSSTSHSLSFAASSSYLPGMMESGQRSSLLLKRSGSADLLSEDSPLESQLQNQRNRLTYHSADRITSLASSVPPVTSSAPPQSPVMIDSAGLLSGDSDESLLESLLNAKIGPLPEPGPDSKRPWFDANSSCDDTDSVALTDVSVFSTKCDTLNNSFQSNASSNSGKDGNGLLKWVPRQEAKAKLKEKLKAHKQKSLEQLQIRQSLGEGQKVPTTQNEPSTQNEPATLGQDEAGSSDVQEKIKKLERIIREQKQTLV